MSARSERQDNISRIIRMLLTATDGAQKDIAQLLDLSDAAVSRRFSSGEWSIDDIDALAAHFKVPVSAFFRDPSELFSPSDQQERRTIWSDGRRLPAPRLVTT